MTGCLNVIFLCITVCVLDPVSFARLFFFSRFWRRCIHIDLGRLQWYESKLTIHHYVHEKSLHTLFHVVMTFCYPKGLRSTTSNPNPQTDCPDMHQDEHPRPWKKIAQKLKLCTSSMLRNFSGPFWWWCWIAGASASGAWAKVLRMGLLAHLTRSRRRRRPSVQKVCVITTRLM